MSDLNLEQAAGYWIPEKRNASNTAMDLLKMIPYGEALQSLLPLIGKVLFSYDIYPNNDISISGNSAAFTAWLIMNADGIDQLYYDKDFVVTMKKPNGEWRIESMK